MKSDWRERKIRIMDVIHSSSVDGTGFRDVLFVSGCPHHCEGCHNMQSWNYNAGKCTTLGDVYDELCESIITNITFSGGEPFEQCDALSELAHHIKQDTSKTIWIYSGYVFEEIIKDTQKLGLLKLCDVLVDGKYEKDNTELNMRFRGSLNQRILDIKKSLSENSPVDFDLNF